MRCHLFPNVAALSAVSDPYGPEENDLSSDTGWLLSAGWAVSGGLVTATSAATGSQAQSPVSATVGPTYRVVVTVDSISAGQFRVVIGSAVQSPNITAPGTYIYEAASTSTARIRLQCQTLAVTCQISQFSIKKVL
jgi:hypothetical protein